VTFHSAVAAAERISLEEVLEDTIAADGNSVALEVGPKKIVTLKVKLK